MAPTVREGPSSRSAGRTADLMWDVSDATRLETGVPTRPSCSVSLRSIWLCTPRTHIGKPSTIQAPSLMRRADLRV